MRNLLFLNLLWMGLMVSSLCSEEAQEPCDEQVDLLTYRGTGCHPEWIYHWTSCTEPSADSCYKDCCDYVDWSDYSPQFNWLVSYRLAYYHPVNSRTHKIYSSGWLDYQVELSKELWCSNWFIWASVNWASKKGRSIGLRHETRANLLPFSVGGKYFFSITPWINAYVGAGICYSFLHIRDRDDFVVRHSSGETVGAVAKSGVQLNLSLDAWDIFIEAFADYIYQDFDFSHGKKNVKRHHADLSGYKVGGGIGIYF